MSPPRQWCGRYLGIALLLWVVSAHGQFSFSDQNATASVSGQFQVSRVDESVPPNPDLNPALNTNLVQLKTSLLAVAAERFKFSVRQELGLPGDATWSGKIYLRVHPARSLDDTVTITSSPFLDHWNYGVEFPDILFKARYARALSSVLLLEVANRHAGRDDHCAEVPAWLIDGMAQQVLATDGDKVLLSAPHHKGGDLPVNRINFTERGFDPLAGARRILQNYPAATFDQLSWPTDAQMEGDDGGAYYASAQLFLSELAGLKNGREKLCAMLDELPRCMNWQTAFFHAFNADFKLPLDVEKWWALRLINFVQRAPGPRWTPDVSVARLQELLSVPVEFRGKSNALPAHAEISLQSALQYLNPDQREAVLRTKERDLALVELRLAPPFGALADGYRLALADFLGDLRKLPQATPANKHGVPASPHASAADTLKRLNVLDARRRDAETRSLATVRPKAAPGASQTTIPGPNGF